MPRKSEEYRALLQFVHDHRNTVKEGKRAFYSGKKPIPPKSASYDERVAWLLGYKMAEEAL